MKITSDIGEKTERRNTGGRKGSRRGGGKKKVGGIGSTSRTNHHSWLNRSTQQESHNILVY